MVFADPLAALHAYRGRALVVSAANDAQVPGSDADRIFAALGSDAKDKIRVTIADANHVYKSETRAPSTISQAEIAAGYADENHPLADGLVDAIVGFVTTTVTISFRTNRSIRPWPQPLPSRNDDNCDHDRLAQR